MKEHRVGSYQAYCGQAEDALTALRSMPAEPVAWAATSEEGKVEALGMNQSRRFDTPLCFCATPHTAPVPKVVSSNLPVVSKAVLSEAEILEIMREWPVETNVWADHIDFARAIERAVRGEKL